MLGAARGQTGPYWERLGELLGAHRSILVHTGSPPAAGCRPPPPCRTRCPSPRPGNPPPPPAPGQLGDAGLGGGHLCPSPTPDPPSPPPPRGGGGAARTVLGEEVEQSRAEPRGFFGALRPPEPLRHRQLRGHPGGGHWGHPWVPPLCTPRPTRSRRTLLSLHLQRRPPSQRGSELSPVPPEVSPRCPRCVPGVPLTCSAAHPPSTARTPSANSARASTPGAAMNGAAQGERPSAEPESERGNRAMAESSMGTGRGVAGR